MNKKLFAVASGLLVAVLVFSNAFAGGGIKVSSVTFTLGSLIANGTVTGLGNTDVTMKLDGVGIPAITCTNQGGNQVPGQSSPKVTASGTEALNANNYTKNGSSPFGVETLPPAPLTWDQAGCPNSNWTPKITFIFWTGAIISVIQTSTGTVLVTQKYVCTTTLKTVSCTPAP